MTYPEAIAYLLGRVNYEQLGMPVSEVLRLDRVRRLLALLGNPHRSAPVIHVAGTKGKGSTATMIARLVQSTGIRTGLHTSPHLDRVEERMLIDGVPATEVEFTQLVERIEPAVARIDAERTINDSELTFFEITTALTFAHFGEQRAECAVVEVGMGGRLDATNVVEPRVCVITSISLDHTKTLGNTITQIAGEKAGIIKPGVPVVSSAIHPEASAVIRATAAKKGCRLWELDRDFTVQCQDADLTGSRVSVTINNENESIHHEFRLGLMGKHQAVNAGVAWLAASLFLKTIHSAPLNSNVLEHLVIPARIEVLFHDPIVILDAAHNQASARALAEAIEFGQATRPRILVFAATKDKDWRSMLVELMPLFDEIVVTQYHTNPRSVPVEQIATFIRSKYKAVYETDQPSQAWQLAWNLLQTKEGYAMSRRMICVTGSFFLASEIRPTIMKSLATCKTV
jgi:dihydrofolate synthase/folylpolyglutamate synthase